MYKCCHPQHTVFIPQTLRTYATILACEVRARPNELVLVAEIRRISICGHTKADVKIYNKVAQTIPSRVDYNWYAIVESSHTLASTVSERADGICGARHTLIDSMKGKSAHVKRTHRARSLVSHFDFSCIVSASAAAAAVFVVAPLFVSVECSRTASHTALLYVVYLGAPTHVCSVSFARHNSHYLLVVLVLAMRAARTKTHCRVYDTQLKKCYGQNFKFGFFQTETDFEFYPVEFYSNCT